MTCGSTVVVSCNDVVSVFSTGAIIGNGQDAANALDFAPDQMTATQTEQLAFSICSNAAAITTLRGCLTGELGTMATQDATAVAITGGSISGITDLAIADGGTGASTALAGFDNLKQAATDAYAGVVELATDAEALAGVDAARGVTPANVEAILASHTVLAGNADGDGLAVALNALNGNIGLRVDITGSTAETALDVADEFLFWDVSASALRKITWAEMQNDISITQGQVA